MFEKIWNSHLVRCFTFSTGTKVTSLIVSLLYTYLIANLLPAEEYGFIMWLMAFVGNLAILAGTQISTDILSVWIAKTRSRELSIKVLKYLGVVLFFTFLGYLGCVGWIVQENQTIWQVAGLLIWLTPIPLFFNAVFWGFKGFGKIWKASTIEILCNLAFTYFFVISGYGITGVLIGKFISLIVSTIIFWFYYRGLRFEPTPLDWKEIKKFAIGTSIVNVIKMARLQVVLIYLGMFAQPVVLAFYYLAQKISSYFVEVPLKTTNEVLLPFASSSNNPKKYVFANIRIATAFTIVCGIALLLAMPYVVEYLFPKFSANELTVFAFLFVLLFFVSNVRTAFNNYFRILNDMRFLSKIELASLILIIGGIYWIELYGVLGLMVWEIVVESLGVLSCLYKFVKR